MHWLLALGILSLPLPRAKGEPVSLAFPSVAVDGLGSLWSVGVELDQSVPDALERARVRLWSERLGAVPIPEPMASGVFHKLLPGGADSMHVFWSRISDAAPRPHTYSSLASELWTATWTAGAWTEPSLVVRADYVKWTQENGQLARSSDGRSHAVLALWDSLGAATYHFARGAGGWQRTRIGPDALHTAIAGSDSTIIALLSAVARDDTPRQLVAARSVDAGQTWEPPIPVADLEDRPFELRIVAAGPLWVAVWVDGMQPSSVHVASSPDGLQWKAGPASTWDGRVRRIAVAGTRCGVVAATVELMIVRNGAPAIEAHRTQFRADDLLRGRNPVSWQPFESALDIDLASDAEHIHAHFVELSPDRQTARLRQQRTSACP